MILSWFPEQMKRIYYKSRIFLSSPYSWDPSLVNNDIPLVVCGIQSNRRENTSIALPSSSPTWLPGQTYQQSNLYLSTRPATNWTWKHYHTLLSRSKHPRKSRTYNQGEILILHLYLLLVLLQVISNKLNMEPSESRFRLLSSSWGRVLCYGQMLSSHWLTPLTTRPSSSSSSTIQDD